MVTAHESLAGGGKHAAFGVDLFTEVLSLDEGVIAAVLADLGFYEAQVFGDFLTNFFGGDLEEALLTVLLLSFEGSAFLSGEQGLGGPGGAPVDALWRCQSGLLPY